MPLSRYLVNADNIQRETVTQSHCANKLNKQSQCQADKSTKSTK